MIITTRIMIIMGQAIDNAVDIAYKSVDHVISLPHIITVSIVLFADTAAEPFRGHPK